MSSLETTRYACGCSEFDGVVERCHEHRVKGAPRCATCRHWMAPEEPGDTVGECQRIGDDDRNEDQEEAWLFVTEYARLCCAPTFGCVLHEEKVK